jgi:hypothetical protein
MATVGAAAARRPMTRMRTALIVIIIIALLQGQYVEARATQGTGIFSNLFRRWNRPSIGAKASSLPKAAVGSTSAARMTVILVHWSVAVV